MHALPPHCKLVATLLFVCAVAATPLGSPWPFVACLTLLLGVSVVARVPLGVVCRRLVFELPFVAFAVLLPFAGGGERVDAGPLSLSAEGMLAAWNLLAKATLGGVAVILLAATTRVPDLLRGLETLRVPRAFTLTGGFMFRYAGIVTAESRRMRIARQSRCHDPRWLWHGGALAATTAALFVRSYERGEKVHVAMLSRGFEGSLPRKGATAEPSDWALSLLLPLAAAVTAALAWT